MSQPEPIALSPREREVLQLLVDGLSNLEIAFSLSISARTVQSHIASLMRKTECRSRTQLAVYALRSGLVSL